MFKCSTFFVVFFIAVIFLSFSSDPCQDLFKKITLQAAEKRNAAVTNFELNCQIKVTESSGSVLNDKILVTLRGSRYYYNSNTATIFQDENNFVAIENESKLIFLAKARPLSGRNRPLMQAFAMIDSLDRFLTFKSCQTETGTVKPGETYQKISFIPAEKLRRTGMKSVTYWLYEPESVVRKILLEYTSDNDSGLKSYEFMVHKLSYAYEGNPFKGRALSQVLDNGTLLPKFKGYRLIDKRNDQ